MKHRIFGKKLGRNHNERQALFRSLTRSMFTHGAIETTEAKAKAVLPLVEKLSSVIVSKPELTARRELFRYLQDQTWVNNVVTTFKATYADQKSNFTKLTKVKFRQGDNSLVVKLSFTKPVKFSVSKPEKEEVKKEVKKAEKQPKKDIKKTVAKKPTKTVKKEVKVEKETQ
jgi:large subunit ribosomal protein L17